MKNLRTGNTNRPNEGRIKTSGILVYNKRPHGRWGQAKAGGRRSQRRGVVLSKARSQAYHSSRLMMDFIPSTRHLDPPEPGNLVLTRVHSGSLGILQQPSYISQTRQDETRWDEVSRVKHSRISRVTTKVPRAARTNG